VADAPAGLDDGLVAELEQRITDLDGEAHLLWQRGTEIREAKRSLRQQLEEARAAAHHARVASDPLYRYQKACTREERKRDILSEIYTFPGDPECGWLEDETRNAVRLSAKTLRLRLSPRDSALVEFDWYGPRGGNQGAYTVLVVVLDELADSLQSFIDALPDRYAEQEALESDDGARVGGFTFVWQPDPPEHTGRIRDRCVWMRHPQHDPEAVRFDALLPLCAVLRRAGDGELQRSGVR
jgi:hypothetical protein